MSRASVAATTTPSRVRATSQHCGIPRVRAEDDPHKTTRRSTPTPTPRKRLEELEHRLVAKESVIKSLEAQVATLKADLEEARTSNAHLLTNNRKLSLDLASAQAKISALSSPHHHKSAEAHQSPGFKDIQKLIASKLEESRARKEGVQSCASSPPPFPKFLVGRQARNSEVETCSPVAPPTPPPPPPPPPRPPPKAPRPPVARLFHLLQKQEHHLSPSVPPTKPPVSTVHSSIVGEIQNRSAHLLAIKSDIETKGNFINDLIQKVLAASFSDMEDVLKFVDWLDEQLSSLADERAVLKHFKWPERKADALREAAVEYRDLRKLEDELYSYSDDPSVPYATALKKMASLLDKCEQSIERVVRLRSSAMRCYEGFKIPGEWMLEDGMIRRIKKASMKVAKTYVKRVAVEVERECAQEALLRQGVAFAYRTYKFAGGLDTETLCALEHINHRISPRLP